MGATTSLPSTVQLAEIGDSYTESGTTTIVANSGTTTFNFDGSVISVSAANLTPQTITPGSTNQSLPFNFDIGAITITAVGDGSTTLEIVSGDPSVTPTVSIPVTVGAVEDESYLNKRGLTHFWENIDEIKQDKLTAGTNITISANNTISASQPTVGNATLTIQKNGTSAGTFTANATSNKTINITVPTTAADVSALPASTKYGASIAVSINTTDYKVTTTLKDQDGNTLGTAQVIDLPLESVVVNGSYDSTNKKIVLTLQNGNTIDIPVGDLVAGLQSEITSTNKLSSDLVDDTNHTHKFVTAAQITKLNGIAAGAEVNVQSDWSVTDSSSDAFIKNKPTIPTVNNGTLTIQKNGASVGTFTANQSGNSTANITVPTKTSDLTNDSDFVEDANYVHTDNNYTTTEKNKLAGIAAGAEVNVQANWAQTTTTADDYIKNKPTIPTVNNGQLTIQKNGTNVATFTANQSGNATANITVPTKTSELTNDSSFVTSSGTVAKADQLTTPRTIAISGGATGTATSFSGASNISIPITNVKSAYVTWGGKDIVGDITPDDAGCTDEFGHNKLAYLPPECIEVWRTVDGGASWVLDSGVSNATKIALVTTSGSASPIYATYLENTITANNIAKFRSRIRIACGPRGSSTKLYTALKKILINFNTNGAGSCKIKMRRRTIANYLSNTETWEDLGTHSISGWSGWNSYPYSGNFGGSMTTQTGQWGQIEFEFWAETYDSRYSCHCAVLDIRFIGTTNWTMPSELARAGHLYTIDTAQNATFPANVNVTGSLGHGNYTYTLPSKNGTVAMTSDLPAAQVNSDWNASSGVAQILNKPTLATVATSGSYNDLSNKPTIPTVNNATLTIQKNGSTVKTFTANASSNVTANITVPTKTSDITNDSNFVASGDLATVATSGSYNDLSNKPTIPTVGNATLTIQKNGTNVQTFTANATSNKTANITVPTKTSDLTNDSNFVASTALATVATSGSYNDLSNKPTIPTVNNATLTIQKNGTNVQTFTANQNTNATANITVPTALSDLSGTVSSSQIADSAVTSSKIDWATLGHHHTASSTQTAINTSNTTLLSFQLTAGTWLLIGTSDFNHANTATGDAFIGFQNLTANTEIGNRFYFNELNNGTYWSVETAHEVVTLTGTANIGFIAKKGQGTLYSTRKSFTAIRIG